MTPSTSGALAGPPATRTPSDPRSFAFERLSATATVLDEHGIIVDTNDAWRLFAQLNGATDKTDLGVSYLDVCDLSPRMGEGEGDAAAVAAGIRRILAGECEHFDFEYPCASPTEERWFLLQASAAPVGGRRGAVLFHVDITSTKVRNQRHGSASDTDDLLGIPGRRRGLEQLGARLAAATRSGTVAAVIVDITGFASINGSYGLRTADEVLVKVAVRIDGLARVDDQLCRLGGDELLLIAAAATAQDLPRTVDRLREVLGAPIQVGSAAVTIDVAIGTAASEPGSTVDSLVHAALSAMQLDKAVRRQASRPPSLVVGATSRPSEPWSSDRLGAVPAFLDLLDDAIVVHDADQQLLHVTPPAVALLGHAISTTTALATGWSVHDDEGRAHRGSRLPLSPDPTGSTHPIRFGLRDPAGPVRWLEVTTRSIDAAAGPGIFVSTIRSADPPPDAATAG